MMLSLLTLFSVFTLWAANPIKLYVKDRNGETQFVQGYNAVAKELHEGDVVEFLDGKRFTLGKGPWSGNTTLVFEVRESPGQVLRIPKYSEEARFLKKMIIGYSTLKTVDIRLADIEVGKNEEYILAKKLPSNVLYFNDIVENKVTFEKKQEMLRALKDFAKKTARLESIADFNTTQIAYDPIKKEWILFDWAEKSILAFYRLSNKQIKYSEHTAFDNFLGQYVKWVGNTEKHLPIYEPKKAEWAWLIDFQKDLQKEILVQREELVRTGVAEKITPQLPDAAEVFKKYAELKKQRDAAQKRAPNCQKSFSVLAPK